MARTDPAAAARAAMPERYGRPMTTGRRAMALLLVAVAALGVGWLLDAAWERANPEVDAAVAGFTVVSDRRVDLTLEIRRGVETGVTCEVYAQSEDTAVVGERRVRLPAAAAGTEQVTVPITTLRRATAAAVRGCVASDG